MARGPNHLALFEGQPDIPTGYALPPHLSVVVPAGEDRTNLIPNPSGETNSTGYTDTNVAVGIARTTDYSFHGAYSIAPLSAPVPGNPGIMYQLGIDTVAGSTYFFSAKFLCLTANITFRIEVMSNTNVVLSAYEFRSTGFWQWVYVPFLETSTTQRRAHFRQMVFPAGTHNWYVDGWQFEACGAGNIFPTTYIDGDQVGFTPNEFPSPYYWNGTQHGSTSVRSGRTRSGGRVLRLSDMGLTLQSIQGLGMAPVETFTLPFGELDGSSYQRTQKESRQFSFAGRITQPGAAMLHSAVNTLMGTFDRDAGPTDEPLLMKYTPMDEEGLVIGHDVDVVCSYSGGMEGQYNNLNTTLITPTYRQHLPSTLRGHDEGESLTGSSTVTSVQFAIKRKADGTWSSFGNPNARPLCMAKHPNGTIYVGGQFTDIGGSGADYAAIYNPLTDTFSVVKAATSFNNYVLSIAISPSGIVYFGGLFTNADGIAAADGIVSYNPSTNTFAALGTGVNANGVYALCFDSAGNLYAGGDFTLMGGVANAIRIAMWNGTVWSALGGGVDNGTVRCLAHRNSKLYMGGTGITTVNGGTAAVDIAYYDTTWHAMGAGADNAVLAMGFDPQGYLIVVGTFDNIGDAVAHKVARWNGVAFSPVGSGTQFPAGAGNNLQSLAILPNGVMYVGGIFTGSSMVSNPPDALVKLSGGVPLFIDADLPGTAGTDGICMMFVDNAGTLYVAVSNTAGTTTATAGAVTVVTNHGKARAYPTIILKGSLTTGTTRLVTLINNTTGKQVDFNYTLQPNEVAILEFDPMNLSFQSNFQGNIANLISQGSDTPQFHLAPGDNRITLMVTGTALSQASISWPIVHATLEGSVGLR